MAVSMGRLEVETADHVVLRYDLAGGGNRGFAAVVDFLLASIIALATVIALQALPLRGSFTNVVFGLAVLGVPLVIWGYFILLEWLWNGQTIGKRAYGLRVISGDGSPAGFTAVFVRNLLRVVDFLPSFYGLGCEVGQLSRTGDRDDLVGRPLPEAPHGVVRPHQTAPSESDHRVELCSARERRSTMSRESRFTAGLLLVILTPKNQRLGDIAAGTYVVRAPKPRIDWFSLRTVTPLGAGKTAEVRRLPGEAQRLVREFVARESGLASRDRARVAAAIAARLRPYASEADAALGDVELIHAVARALRATGGER